MQTRLENSIGRNLGIFDICERDITLFVRRKSRHLGTLATGFFAYLPQQNSKCPPVLMYRQACLEEVDRLFCS